jgi:hypothetical protein
MILVFIGTVMTSACGAMAPSFGTSGGGPTPPPNTGVVVTTLRGPTCPVQHVGDACTAPISVAVTVARPDGSVVATIHTDATGVATVPLVPGIYTLTGAAADGSAQLPRAPAALSVTVHTGAYTPAQLVYDTGIR